MNEIEQVLATGTEREMVMFAQLSAIGELFGGITVSDYLDREVL